MNYIDEAKQELSKHVKIGKGLTDLYALLALVKGEDTTLKDVHDAWAMNINRTWDKEQFGEHFSMIPFEELKPETAAKDQRFVDAIHATAKVLATKKSQ